MKKNEIIELNGVEYTLELNRDSFLKIDQYTNIQKSMQIVQREAYEHIEEIDDNTDPFANEISDELVEQVAEEKFETMKKVLSRAFWIWLYPHHKFNITQINEMLEPYYQDDNKFEWLNEKYVELMTKCVEVRNEYLEQQKNLKAQANKK